MSLSQNTSLPANYCPVCQTSGQAFLPLPPFFWETAARYGFDCYEDCEMTPLDTYSCAACGASDRERLYVWWFNEQIRKGMLTSSSRIVHFAPEAAFSAYIQKLRLFTSYKTADLMMEGVDYNLDLMQIALPDASVDCFLCSHVLEHVPNDRVAVKELYRITASGGFGLLMVPIAVGLEQTREDPTAVTEADHWRLYGQGDHVRLHAKKDFVECIASSGFRVQELTWRHFGAKFYKRLGLNPPARFI